MTLNLYNKNLNINNEYSIRHMASTLLESEMLITVLQNWVGSSHDSYYCGSGRLLKVPITCRPTSPLPRASENRGDTQEQRRHGTRTKRRTDSRIQLVVESCRRGYPATSTPPPADDKLWLKAGT